MTVGGDARFMLRRAERRSRTGIVWRMLFIGALAVSGLHNAHAAPDTADIQRGAYLLRAADCEVCHTQKGGEAFAGGRPFAVKPFGVFYSGNITSDKDTGIGEWSDEAFVRAVREGVGSDGLRLFPGMPYQDYARMSADDIRSIRHYLNTLAPVRKPKPENTGVFGYTVARYAMIGWNVLNGPQSSYPDDPRQSAAWNRGRYLVDGAGHCQECHSPRTWTFAASTRRAYAGSVTEGWRAYNLSSDPQSGLGAWSDRDLADYLSTGHASGHGTASGPMADVIGHSLRFLTATDIQAMIVYLRSLKPQPETSDDTVSRDADTERSSARGQRLFAGACAGCHLPDGAARNVADADLRGAHTVRAHDGLNLVQVITQGAVLETEKGKITMPFFGSGYDQADLADIATYVLRDIGHSRGRVDAQDVRKALREAD